jgi:CheY-like chemotaxis protein
MSKTILIVEDYADVRAMMKILIRTHGYRVVEAADGYDAVEKAKQYRPDLILMDIMMPIMDGINATKVIREIKGLENVPIVALTAYGKENGKRAAQAGVTDVVNKPLSFAELETFLNKYLKN